MGLWHELRQQNAYKRGFAAGKEGEGEEWFYITEDQDSKVRSAYKRGYKEGKEIYMNPTRIKFE